MIDYEMFCKIRDCHDRQGLTIAQTSRALGLHSATVAKWLARSQFEPRRIGPRHSILDPFKPHIAKLLNEYPYTVRQTFLRLYQKGYRGSRTTLRDYIYRIRPPKKINLRPRRQNGFWTRARVKEIASTCSTLSQFRKYGVAFGIALKKGWIPEVCPHLPFVGRPSSSYTLRIEHARRSNLDNNIPKSSKKRGFFQRTSGWLKVASH